MFKPDITDEDREKMQAWLNQLPTNPPDVDVTTPARPARTRLTRPDHYPNP